MHSYWQPDSPVELSNPTRILFPWANLYTTSSAIWAAGQILDKQDSSDAEMCWEMHPWPTLGAQEAILSFCGVISYYHVDSTKGRDMESSCIFVFVANTKFHSFQVP